MAHFSPNWKRTPNAGPKGPAHTAPNPYSYRSWQKQQRRRSDFESWSPSQEVRIVGAITLGTTHYLSGVLRPGVRGTLEERKAELEAELRRIFRTDWGPRLAVSEINRRLREVKQRIKETRP